MKDNFCPTWDIILSSHLKLLLLKNSRGGVKINIFDHYAAYEVAIEASHRQKISGLIWITLGLIQATGVLRFPIYGVPMLICGATNVVIGISRIKKANMLKSRSNIILDDFDKQLLKILVLSLLNLVFGAGIGLIACFYDWFLRSYVLDNKWVFNISRDDAQKWLERHEEKK